MRSIYFILVLISLLLIPKMVHAENFEYKHYKVIKDIIWAADKVEVPRALLLAICWGESSFRTDSAVTHLDGKTLSYGVCQIKLSLAQQMDKVYKHKHPIVAERLLITKVNAFYAAKALKFHLSRYNGNWQLAADAYNKYNAVSENTPYVKSVNKHIHMLQNKITALKDEYVR